MVMEIAPGRAKKPAKRASPKTGKMRREVDLRAIQKENQALDLRLAGATYDVIARECQFTHRSAARKAVGRALYRIQAEPVKQIREMEQARLDRMMRAIWPKVLRGELDAIATALRIEERRSKLLGLDQADRVDIEQRVRVIAVSLGLDPEQAVLKAQIVLAERGG